MQRTSLHALHQPVCPARCIWRYILTAVHCNHSTVHCHSTHTTYKQHTAITAQHTAIQHTLPICNATICKHSFFLSCITITCISAKSTQISWWIWRGVVYVQIVHPAKSTKISGRIWRIYRYGVATVSRMLKNTGLFAEYRSLL